MHRFIRSSLILALPVFAVTLLNARSREYTNGDTSDKSTDATVMGCLVQGSQPGQYEIQGPNTTYVLTSKRVKLAKYVGNDVSASGGMKMMNYGGSEVEHLKVDSLSRAARSCE